MKKHLTMVITAIFIIGCLTACSNSGAAQPDNQSSVTDSAPSDTESSSSDTESSDPGSESSDGELEIKPKTVYIYGETEIPDIPCGDINFEGKANTMNDHDALEQGLDRMVFETHTFGDYTVRLVGDKVRTDKANFPDSIYVQGLGAEVRKNGEKIEEHSDTYYSAYINYGSQFQTEEILFTDKIGNYLDIYDLENPVIAMRYFFDDDPERTVTKAVEFVIIKEDMLCGDLFGICEKGLGVTFSDFSQKDGPSKLLTLTTEEGWGCMDCIFAADEFKIADSNTLIDEEAGIKYTFDFISDPYECGGHLYTVEKISET